MFFLFIPYWLLVLAVPILAMIPFYFFNQYLIRKINPKKNGRQFLFYLLVITLTVFIYISMIVYLIIAIARMLK